MGWGCLKLILSCALFITTASSAQTPSQNPDHRFITLLGTNDIHGHVEPRQNYGKKSGGMAFFAGVVDSIRQGLHNQYGDRAGVLVLDAGDQFQGTLLSNYSEGNLVFSAMNEIHYDAVVPGNHDYDFGPEGWLEDRVTPTSSSQNPRGVLEKLIKKARFPLLSANVYLKNSIVDERGDSVSVDGRYCKPLETGKVIEWKKAKKLEIFQSYLIKNIADTRVAVIGLDHAITPAVTTAENVSDLCFRDPIETYREVRKDLEGKADLFIMLIHDGDTNKDRPLTQRIESLASEPNQVHAVISGHTHFVIENTAHGVPIIQSGSDGERFGRIDLIWNSRTRQIIGQPKTLVGIRLFHEKCDEKALSFCSEFRSESNGGSSVSYEGVPVRTSAKIESETKTVRTQIQVLSTRHLGTAQAPLSRDRIHESPLADMLSDALRSLSGADIAFLNTGGIRDNIPAGRFDYESLFQVLPFNNHAVVLGPMSWKPLYELVDRSVRTCGKYGSLMQSGLKVRFTRNCDRAIDGVDPQARVLSIQTIDGKVLYNSRDGIFGPPPSQAFVVATLDFLASGGSEYGAFVGVPQLRDLGNFRERIADHLEGHPTLWSGAVDDRWIEQPGL